MFKQMEHNVLQSKLVEDIVNVPAFKEKFEVSKRNIPIQKS